MLLMIISVCIRKKTHFYVEFAKYEMYKYIYCGCDMMAMLPL